ncbi:MAG TPA: calcium-binding protein [Microvirga sp.]|nr:calcium-binding protein [Microvirga sp.]
MLITADWWNQQDYVPKCCIIPPRRPVDGPATGYVIVGDSANNLVALVSTFGTTGSDVLSGSGVIFAGDGNDFIIGGFGADFINGEAGDDTLLGGEGTDLLSGDAGNDTLISGDGNDTLTGGSGADLLSGGSGVDMVSYASSAAGVIINLATGRGTGGDAAGDQVRDIENVIGSGFNDVISVGNASVVGFDAANYYAMNPDVQAYAAAHGLGYDWAFEHWVANGRFEGRAGGWEGMSQAAGADWGTLFSVQKYLAANSDILAYKLAHNLSDQWVHEHWLTAGRHEGRAGALDVSGSAIDAGAGNDVVQGGLYSDYVTGNTGNDTINGYAGDDVLLGGAGHDAINGGDGNDHIFGGLDDDGLVGAKGNDSLSGGTGNDSLFGDDGNDTLAGGSGTDTLYGGAGDDYLDIEDLATAGADELHGGDGNDVLVGGGVGSKLTGGAGYDIFSIRPNAKTTIMDFYTGPGAHDQIYIWNKPLFADFSAMMATARQVGSDVVIEKSDFSLTLSNTQLSSLIANDFVFL